MLCCAALRYAMYAIECYAIFVIVKFVFLVFLSSLLLFVRSLLHLQVFAVCILQVFLLAPEYNMSFQAVQKLPSDPPPFEVSINIDPLLVHNRSFPAHHDS